MVKLSTNVKCHRYHRLRVRSLIPWDPYLFTSVRIWSYNFTLWCSAPLTHYIILNYQLTKKTLHHCLPQVERRQILFDASRERQCLYEAGYWA